MKKKNERRQKKEGREEERKKRKQDFRTRTANCNVQSLTTFWKGKTKDALEYELPNNDIASRLVFLSVTSTGIHTNGLCSRVVDAEIFRNKVLCYL